MNKKKQIKALLKEKILILDGATGTELQKKGMPSGVCPELWSLENKDLLSEIHDAYINAGSNVIYTCTLGANRFKLDQYRVKKIREINRELARVAVKAAGKRSLIAGDIGPTGLFVDPFGSLDFEEAVTAFKEQVRGLIEGGVNLFIIETMFDIQEARAALLAVKETCNYFTMVSMTYEPEGRTLNGTDPVTALITLQSLGADAVGCNCSTGPDSMANFVTAMKPYARVPLIVKPNAGIPRLAKGKTIFDMDASTFASFGKKLAAAGANMIGGCCGTGPEFIRQLKRNLQNLHPSPPLIKSLSAVSSARRYKIFEKQDPLVIVGERLNPTGKKLLQQELLEGKMGIVRRMAKEQEQKGAELLDVNVGVPGIDDIKAIRQVIQLLAVASDLPLVIDSSRIETIEAALRYYPGRALINSITGEKEKIERLLPIAAKYGAMFILLPLMEGEIPEMAEKRKMIIKNVFQNASRLGFTKDDIVTDGLVMTVASNQQAAQETLNTIKWCTEVFKCRTILGISNVSFGMPEREWINATFFAMAQATGLTMAIANPVSEKLMSVKMAGDVLLKKDRNASSYIAHFSTASSKGSEPSSPLIKSSPNISAGEKVYEAILEGNRDTIIELIEEAIKSGMEAPGIVDTLMIPAITQVGELFDKKIYYLPQLIASAETMKNGLSYLEPKLQSKYLFPNKKARIVFATVKGDIHDIGKNIVALMLRNHGFQIIDLGKDVPAETIIMAIKEERPDIVALSALMTTTMVNMKDIIDQAVQDGLTQKFMVGGAVVTKSYAQSIGAAYAKDGVEAVRIAEQLVISGNK